MANWSPSSNPPTDWAPNLKTPTKMPVVWGTGLGFGKSESLFHLANLKWAMDWLKIYSKTQDSDM